MIATPFNRLLQSHDSLQKLLDPVTQSGARMLDHLINREALIIAYNNDYRIMMWMVVPCLALLLVMKRPARKLSPLVVARAEASTAPAE